MSIQIIYTTPMDNRAPKTRSNDRPGKGDDIAIMYVCAYTHIYVYMYIYVCICVYIL